MLSVEDNELLTRSGRGTPMGELLRRFWVPVLLSEELPEPDGDPRRLTVMGEKLLAFRDTAGRVGVIDPRCAHRGADLYFGRNEHGGIRCVYHGWKFDADGRTLEVPNAPRESTFTERVRITAYPTREWGGIVWAYLGPAGDVPELPMLEFGLVPAAHRFVTKKWQDCNWVQSLEGGIDTAHFSFLHMLIAHDEHELLSRLKHAAIGAQAVKNDRVRWVRDDPCPTFEIDETDAGLVIGGARRADGDDLYWRIAQFMMPFHALAPNAFPGEALHGQTWVPVDDTHCWIYTYSWHPDRAFTEDDIRSYRSGHSVHAQVDERYVPLRNAGNEYLLDREDQRLRSFTGIQGVSEQDAAIQDSQGPIVDRSLENLTPTDLAIVRFRRLMLGAARDLARGVEPRWAKRGAAYAVRSGGWVADRSVRLADVMRQRFGHPHGWVGDRHGLGVAEPTA